MLFRDVTGVWVVGAMESVLGWTCTCEGFALQRSFKTADKCRSKAAGKPGGFCCINLRTDCRREGFDFPAHFAARTE
jgi:hypothetical protein